MSEFDYDAFTQQLKVKLAEDKTPKPSRTLHLELCGDPFDPLTAINVRHMRAAVRAYAAERAQIAGEHLHGRDAAILYGLDELGAIGEGEVVAAPQAEPLGIGEIVDGRRAGRRDVDDPGVRESVLEPEPRTALLRRRNVAPFSLPASGILHRVAFVEDDHSIEIGAQPFDDLLDPRKLLAPVVGP